MSSPRNCWYVTDGPVGKMASVLLALSSLNSCRTVAGPEEMRWCMLGVPIVFPGRKGNFEDFGLSLINGKNDFIPRQFVLIGHFFLNPYTDENIFLQTWTLICCGIFSWASLSSLPRLTLSYCLVQWFSNFSMWRNQLED